MAIHPGGDNIITGSYDCRLHWFDMDLSTKPYQTLKYVKNSSMTEMSFLMLDFLHVYYLARQTMIICAENV